MSTWGHKNICNHLFLIRGKVCWAVPLVCCRLSSPSPYYLCSNLSDPSWCSTGSLCVSLFLWVLWPPPPTLSFLYVRSCVWGNPCSWKAQSIEFPWNESLPNSSETKYNHPHTHWIYPTSAHEMLLWLDLRPQGLESTVPERMRVKSVPF